MPTEQIPTEKFAAEPNSRPDAREVRARAIRQIERRRRFYRHTIAYAGAGVLLIVIWAVSEYHNAGGWPSDGFSQSSGTSHVWNIWIIYPILGLGLLLGIDAWKTFGEKPISESEIRREIDRLK
jgi:hypothetical protein